MKNLQFHKLTKHFFEFLLKYRNAPHKKMKTICDKLNKIIANKNKLAKLEKDF